MGLIDRVFGMIFGGGRNILRETAEVFTENAENGAVREAALRSDALEQFAREFRAEHRGAFDRFMDAINRIPRPAMALGTLGLFVAAMVDPLWFASRMQGIALVPEPLWWLLGAIVSFYFGARHQLKNQQFSKQIANTLSRMPGVLNNISALDELRESQPEPIQRQEPPLHKTQGAGPKLSFPDNAALQEWANH